MAGPAMADGLASYSGTGTVYVLEDGRVAIEYTSPSQEAHQLEIEDASEHYLISDGTTFTLLPPNTSPPAGTVSMVQLNGTGCEAVGRFAGSLSVTSLGDDVWEIQVQNVTSTVIFDYLY